MVLPQQYNQPIKDAFNPRVARQQLQALQPYLQMDKILKAGGLTLHIILIE